MVATSGAQLLPNEAITNLREHIIPLTTVLTPNIPEARLLLQNAGLPAPDIESLSDIVTMAKLVQSLGPEYVLVKGGHSPLTKDDKISAQNADRTTVVDVLHDGHTCTIMKTDYSPSKNTHGTGCSLACMFPPNPFCLRLRKSSCPNPRNLLPAAIASNLALGEDIPKAVSRAVQYVEIAIRTSQDLGHGSGPINHFHSVSVLSTPPGSTSLRQTVLHRGENR